MLRKRARKQLLTNCTLLREFADIFWSTTYMADLAEETIRELDKVCLTIAQSQQERTGNSTGNASAAFTSEFSISREIATSPSNLDGEETGAPHRNSHSLQAPHDIGDSQAYEAVPFDPSDFENMPELDIFQHFDPNFDLEGIDAALFNFDDLLTG
jgi:hypothetical protein